MFKELETNELDTQRYTLLSKPRTRELLFEVGSHTSVADLGTNADDILHRGGVNVPAH